MIRLSNDIVATGAAGPAAGGLLAQLVARLRAEGPEEEYARHVPPEKIRLNKEYLRRSSFVFDLGLIAKTVCRLFA